MGRYGRSFRLASRVLPAAVSADVALLYAFCRRVDDWADELHAQQAVPALAQLRHEWRLAAPSDPVARDAFQVAQRHGIDGDVVDDFLAALERDTGPVQVGDETALLRFCYGVAGTVGLMLTRVFGVRSRVADSFAADLGIAMQLTNIARDVCEDAARGRVYLPAEWTGGAIDPAALRAGDPDARRRAWDGVTRILARAHGYYRRAEHGLPYLPFRIRWGVLIASRLYEAIGDEVLRQRDPFGATRAGVGWGRKLRIAAAASWELITIPRLRRLRPGSTALAHDARSPRPLAPSRAEP